MITTDDELILADGIADPDPDAPCNVEDCDKPAEVLLGEGEMELCADHAAELALQALRIIEVQDALARRQMAVLVLDDQQNDLQRLEILAAKATAVQPEQQAFLVRLRQWIEERKAALYEGGNS